MPPQTPVPPALLGRPFLLAEARQAGISRQVLRGRRFRRIFHTVYVSAETPESLALTADAALLLAPPGSKLSHHTAALLRGLPVPPPGLVHVTAPADTRRARLTGVRVHWDESFAPGSVSPAGQERERVEGRLLSGPAENFVELGEYLSLMDLVVLGDAMVRRGFATCAQLVDAAATSTRRRGVRFARRAAALVRPRVDSPMETRARLLLVFAGLPEPITNLVVRDIDGGWVGAVDLGYATCRVAIEYHGDVHRSSPKQWRSDVAKVEHLRRLGWRVVILTSDDVYARPYRTLARVREALEEAGHPALPHELDSAWREHFSRDQLAQTVHARAAS